MYCLLSLAVDHDGIPFDCPHLKWSNGGFDVAGCFAVVEGLIRRSPMEEDIMVTQLSHTNVLFLATSHEPRDTKVLRLPIYNVMLATCPFHILRRGEIDAKWSYGERGIIH